MRMAASSRLHSLRNEKPLKRACNLTAAFASALPTTAVGFFALVLACGFEGRREGAEVVGRGGAADVGALGLVPLFPLLGGTGATRALSSARSSSASRSLRNAMA